MLLTLALWLGALIFFPVVASIAFSVLPAAHLAGLLVRSSLLALHWIGLFSGPVFLAASALYDRALEGQIRVFRASHAAIVLMVLLTALSQFRIVPRMDGLRAAAGDMASLAPSSPIRLEFDSLHTRSVHIESTTLVLAVMVLYLTSRRFGSPTP
jgi:hypothetical protein